jgi:hypothetical protein
MTRMVEQTYSRQLLLMTKIRIRFLQFHKTQVAVVALPV